MSMWHTVLQDASFKGVRFDVVSIEESDGKALVEHAVPFTDGTVLEDMGTTGRQVQVSAVFWGKGYHGRLNALLEALMARGAGVLVHPVWGRLDNMLAASWHFRHEADYADYAALDITFRESGAPQKIFVFENQFLMGLERLIRQIDAYRAALEGFIDAVLAAKQQGKALIGSAWGFWSALKGCFAAVKNLFGFDDFRFGGGGKTFQASTFRADVRTARRQLHDMVCAGLYAAAGLDDTGAAQAADGSRTARQRFAALLNRAGEVGALARQVQAAQTRGRHNATAAQLQTVAQQLRLSALAAQFQAAAALIEEDGDAMTAADLMWLNRNIRLNAAAEIAALRQDAAKNPLLMHDAAETVIEGLRQLSGSLNTLVAAAINRKPPLLVRPAPLDGTMQQIAFAFYGDIGRTDELVRLNPHITHPTFVGRGAWINGYAK